MHRSFRAYWIQCRLRDRFRIGIGVPSVDGLRASYPGDDGLLQHGVVVVKACSKRPHESCNGHCDRDSDMKHAASGAVRMVSSVAATAWACGVALVATSVALVQGQFAQVASPLRLIATISMSNVAGRIDHLALDLARQRLFVAALGNNTIEVIDTSKNVYLRSVPGFHESQGVAVLPDLNAVAVTNGDTGTLRTTRRERPASALDD